MVSKTNNPCKAFLIPL